MNGLKASKAAARKAARARRKPIFDAAPAGQAKHLNAVLSRYHGAPLAGFMPIGTEIDPTPAMVAACADSSVGVPVITGADQALKFACWTPQTPMISGAFGAMIPSAPVYMEPEIVVVPLLAFTRRGDRLGYGGGFYDRTLQQLRAKRLTLAIGFAFAGQEVPDIPLENTDQPLDLVVTEAGVIDPRIA
ncbi:MAG: 5-formyltetrahydrofolate cyclo-ligase [Pseudomonadota bacterium]